jgi:Amt family ammonium transporter
MGLLVSPLCFFFVTTVKNLGKYDDSLDVFGVHCVGGIFGALATGIVANPLYGGQGTIDYTAAVAKPGVYDMAAQMLIQLQAVGITLVWSGGVSAVLFLILKYTIGIRPSEEVEHEGLDISEHGERAYNY